MSHLCVLAFFHDNIRVIDPQALLFPDTESSVDALWSEWQKLTEAERGQFLDRVRRERLTRAQTKKMELEATKKPREAERMEANSR